MSVLTRFKSVACVAVLGFLQVFLHIAAGHFSWSTIATRHFSIGEEKLKRNGYAYGKTAYTTVFVRQQGIRNPYSTNISSKVRIFGGYLR